MPNESPSNPRVCICSNFPWNRASAYLFDIDGTLLRSRDRIHFNSFAAGVHRVTGQQIDLTGVSLAGNTDLAILTEAWRAAGLSSRQLARHKKAICQAMGDWVKEHREQLEPVVMPAVESMLTHLARRHALLGVATGNLEEIGWTKLERAGLRKWFRFGGFSDRFTVRTRMVAAAASTARKLLKKRKAVVCVVGDTPRDIEAAHGAGLPVIAVATGHYSFEELVELRPEVCTSNLAALLAMAE